MKDKSIKRMLPGKTAGLNILFIIIGFIFFVFVCKLLFSVVMVSFKFKFEYVIIFLIAVAFLAFTVFVWVDMKRGKYQYIYITDKKLVFKNTAKFEEASFNTEKSINLQDLVSYGFEQDYSKESGRELWFIHYEDIVFCDKKGRQFYWRMNEYTKKQVRQLAHIIQEKTGIAPSSMLMKKIEFAV